jgi:hypothetical protein
MTGSTLAALAASLLSLLLSNVPGFKNLVLTQGPLPQAPDHAHPGDRRRDGRFFPGMRCWSTHARIRRSGWRFQRQSILRRLRRRVGWLRLQSGGWCGIEAPSRSQWGWIPYA